MLFEELNRTNKQCMMLWLPNNQQCVREHTKLKQELKYLVGEENHEDKKELVVPVKVQLERPNEKVGELCLDQLPIKTILSMLIAKLENYRLNQHYH